MFTTGVALNDLKTERVLFHFCFIEIHAIAEHNFSDIYCFLFGTENWQSLREVLPTIARPQSEV